MLEICHMSAYSQLEGLKKELKRQQKHVVAVRRDHVVSFHIT